MNKITLEEFDKRVADIESKSASIQNIGKHPIMQADCQTIDRDPASFTAASNRIVDAVAFATTSPSADDTVRMMLYLMSSYPLKPFPSDVNHGMFAADGVYIYANPKAVSQISDPEVVAIMVHELGHILLDDMAAHRTMNRVLDNTNLKSGDEAVPDIAHSVANLFIDPCVDKLAIDTAKSCKAVDQQFVQQHYYMCVDKVQALLDVSLSTGAQCDNADHQALFAAGAGYMYNEMCKQHVVSTDPTKQGLSSDKWRMLISLAQLMCRAVESPDGVAGSASNAGIGDVIDNEVVSIGDITSKREAAVDNAANSCGVDAGSYDIKNQRITPSNCIEDYLPQLILSLLGGEDSYAAIDPVVGGMGASLPVSDLAPSRVAIALDVSGSVVFCQEEFAVLLGELSTALKSPLVSELTLVLFDYGEIREENVFTLPHGADIEAVLNNATGGGGTEFDNAVHKLEQLSEAEDPIGMIVILTDGMANFTPDSHNSDIPRVWISTHSDTEHLDPQHQHVLLKDRKEKGRL